MYEPGGLAVAACIEGAANEVFMQVDDRAKTSSFLLCNETQSLTHCQFRLPSLQSYCKVLAIKFHSRRLSTWFNHGRPSHRTHDGTHSHNQSHRSR